MNRLSKTSRQSNPIRQSNPTSPTSIELDSAFLLIMKMKNFLGEVTTVEDIDVEVNVLHRSAN